MTVFEFRYNWCIYECGMITVSLHKTSKGAIKAMEKHKTQKKKEWEKTYSDEPGMKKDFPFAMHEYWDVIETEVLE